jgi:hypothetical protein
VQLIYFCPARQSPLQDEAREVLAWLDLAALVADVGPLLVTGSFVSGLMCWRQLDVTVLASSDFSPQDVMALLARIARRAGVTGLEYYDERGRRCVAGQVRDERYQVALTVEQGGRPWQIDLTVRLHDLYQNDTRWHEVLRERITAKQRGAVLRIKDDWHRRPEYPQHAGGLEICTAMIDGGSVPRSSSLAGLLSTASRRPSHTGRLPDAATLAKHPAATMPPRRLLAQ